MIKPKEVFHEGRVFVFEGFKDYIVARGEGTCVGKVFFVVEDHIGNKSLVPVNGHECRVIILEHAIAGLYDRAVAL